MICKKACFLDMQLKIKLREHQLLIALVRLFNMPAPTNSPSGFGYVNIELLSSPSLVDVQCQNRNTLLRAFG